MFWNDLSRKEQILMAKRFFEYRRYDDYLKRFSDENALANNSKTLLKKHSFFPCSAFTDAISERIELTPSNFLITGKEKDFLKENLIDDSNLISKLPSLYKEQDLAGDAFWKLNVVESTKSPFTIPYFNVSSGGISITPITAEP